MAEKILKNVRIDGKLTDLVAEDGKIKSIGKCDAPGEDCGGYDLYPGLFDIHAHGCVGFDTMEIMDGGLTEDTIKANSRFFASIDEVPTRALTMGMGSIMMAKKIILLANGKNKHAAVSALLDSRITTAVPATLLKLHPDVIILCDKEAYHG